MNSREEKINSLQFICENLDILIDDLETNYQSNYAIIQRAKKLRAENKLKLLALISEEIQ